jgi:hypothetical protein
VDPTAALTTIRTLVAEAHKLNPDDDPIVLAATLDDLATTIDGLDRWLSSGGFTPLPWAPGQTEAVAR